jgi:predicted DNA-binding transcriptional regulator YafY
MIPRKRIARLETDYDAILEAQGFVARSGPRPRINEEIARHIAGAIKVCRYVEIVYKAYGDVLPKSRKLAPYGLLSGLRRYLVAHDPQSRRQGAIKTYRMDAISSVTVLDDYFTRPEDFDLQAFANRAFGLFQRDGEFSTIVWRFKPEAAEQARGFLFHPSQTEVLQEDGSLIVKFEASGQLEMAWHLYTWGDKVEVVEPAKLRDFVAGHQRSDFPAMP